MEETNGTSTTEGFHNQSIETTGDAGDTRYSKEENIPELDVSRKDSKIIISFDSLTLNDIEDCNRKADYIHNVCIKPVFRNENSLSIGLMFHAMLQEHYTCIMRGGIPYSIIKTRALEAGENWHLKYQRFDTETAESVKELYLLYSIRYEHESWIPLAVEESFSISFFENEHFRLIATGIIDLLVQTRSTPIHPVDHKTHGRDDPQYRPREMDNQFRMYMWATKTWNITVNRAHTDTKDETKRFTRPLLNAMEGNLEEWRKDKAMRIIQHFLYLQDGYSPMNNKSCAKYGGCPYEKLCNADPRDRQYQIQVYYETVPAWDPLKRDE